MDTYELYAIDGLLTDEERAIRDTVRDFGVRELRPHVAQWFEDGDLPVRDLARALGRLGVLGMHLDGYGCAGTGAVAYGLACQEVEAVDSGLRSLVSVQGSLAMYAIHRYGSEEQKQEWLPAMAAGERIGCFGLTEPDAGSNPAAMRTVAKRDGDDWVLNGSKQWITNGSVADVAVVWARTHERVRGFVVPTDAKGFSSTPIHHKLSLRASVSSALAFDDLRLPGSALLPEAAGLSGPLGCLNEARFGIVFGALGAARDSLQTAVDYASTREVFDKPLSAYQLTQKKLADMAVELGNGMLLALHLGRLKEAGTLTPEQVSVGKLNNVRKSIEIARECRTILG
ncbi:MAG: acyl-CoA dehydrogenase family protein, partial [Lapillicoccus sp.]